MGRFFFLDCVCSWRVLLAFVCGWQSLIFESFERERIWGPTIKLNGIEYVSRDGFPSLVFWYSQLRRYLIQIRGIYRILEYAQGQDGYLLIHEAYISTLNIRADASRFLYSLDSAPIFVATAIFVVPGFFPGKLLSMKPYRSREESIEMDHAIATI